MEEERELTAEEREERRLARSLQRKRQPGAAFRRVNSKQNSVSSSSSAAAARPKKEEKAKVKGKPDDGKIDVPRQWEPAHICEALYVRDHQWYKAKVEKATGYGSFWVVFEDSGQRQECIAKALRPCPGFPVPPPKEDENASAQSSGPVKGHSYRQEQDSDDEELAAMSEERLRAIARLEGRPYEAPASKSSNEKRSVVVSESIPTGLEQEKSIQEREEERLMRAFGRRSDSQHKLHELRSAGNEEQAKQQSGEARPPQRQASESNEFGFGKEGSVNDGKVEDSLAELDKLDAMFDKVLK